MKKLLLSIMLCSSVHLNGMKNSLSQDTLSGVMGPEMPLELKELIIINYLSDLSIMNVSFNETKNFLITDYLSNYSNDEMSSELKGELIADFLKTYHSLDFERQKYKYKASVQNLIDSIIKNIKSISLVSKDLNQIVNNPVVFKKCLHKLAYTFNMSTFSMIQHFKKMPVVETYRELGVQLIQACSAEKFMVEVPKIVNDGADVNFILMGSCFSPLYIAVYRKNVELLKLLLHHGAQPLVDETNKKLKKLNKDLLELKAMITKQENS